MYSGMDGRHVDASGAGAWQDSIDALARRWSEDPSERRQSRSRRREQEILKAALRVFSREGIAKARIADVAAEAGMPLSSIYEYYRSKEEIAYAVPITFMGRFFAEYAERARGTATMRERLRLFLWLSADFGRRNPDWARTLYLEIWPSVLVKDSPARESLDAYANILVGMIRDGAAQGEWAVGPDPYETAAILIGSHNHVVITWLLYRRPRDIMRAIGPLLDRLIGAILPEVAAPVPATSPATAGPRPEPAGAKNSGGKSPGAKKSRAKAAGATGGEPARPRVRKAAAR